MTFFASADFLNALMTLEVAYANGPPINMATFKALAGLLLIQFSTALHSPQLADPDIRQALNKTPANLFIIFSL